MYSNHTDENYAEHKKSEMSVNTWSANGKRVTRFLLIQDKPGSRSVVSSKEMDLRPPHATMA